MVIGVGYPALQLETETPGFIFETALLFHLGQLGGFLLQPLAKQPIVVIGKLICNDFASQLLKLPGSAAFILTRFLFLPNTQGCKMCALAGKVSCKQ